MRVTRITTNLAVPDIEAAKEFYAGYLGLTTEEFNLGWVARMTAPDTGEHVQLVTRDATAPVDSVMSVRTDDVDGAYAEAIEARLRDRAPADRRNLGSAKVLRPGPGRQRSQRRRTRTRVKPTDSMAYRVNRPSAANRSMCA